MTPCLQERWIAEDRQNLYALVLYPFFAKPTKYRNDQKSLQAKKKKRCKLEKGPKDSSLGSCAEERNILPKSSQRSFCYLSFILLTQWYREHVQNFI